MNIVHGHQADVTTVPRSDVFTGEVQMNTVLPSTEGVMIGSVLFPPGARTNWHTHERGQILHVLAGRGQVYDREGTGSPIGPGDVVFISPGEEHWHGAQPDSYMVHLAISLGEAVWLDPVADDDYARGSA